MSLEAKSTYYDFIRDAQALLTETQDLLNALKSYYNGLGFGPSILESVTTSKFAYTTTSTSFSQAGYGVAFTPGSTGRVLIIAIVTMSNNTAGDGATAQLSYRSGIPPSTSGSATGTVFTSAASVTSETANQNAIATLVGTISGLSVGTAYWFDVQLEAITGGTASVQLLGYVIIEF